ncbi:hypothetical protein V6N13_126768 [Hibiscus sabdariffa]
MYSSNESPKEPEEVTKAPTNAKNKRKGKKTIEATSERGKQKQKSVVWDHFKEVEGDAYHAECIYCHQKISCASSNGTNAMKRHTSRCKKAPFNVDTKQTILDFEFKTKCNADGTIETVSVPKNYGILINMRLEKHLLEWWLLMSCQLVLCNVKNFVIFAILQFLVLFHPHVLLLLEIAMLCSLKKERS